MKLWKHNIKHSLSSKLLVLFIVMAVLFLFMVGGSLRLVFKHHFDHNVRSHLVQYLKYVREDIGLPADYERARQLADSLNIEIGIFDDRGIWSSSNRQFDISNMEIEYGHMVEGIEYAQVEIHEEEFFMMRVEQTRMLFNIPNLRQEKQGVRAFLPLLVLLLVLFALYHATRYLFAPILHIQDGVKRIGSGELNHRVDVNRRDELGVLADDVNTMAQDIQKMLDAKRQLLLAVSHELRSPLTRANVATEMLSEEKLKQHIKTDLQEMEHLIEEILETERLNTRHNVLDKREQSLNELIRETIAAYFENDVINLELPEQVINANVDAARIKLLLKNLIENALKYTSNDSKAVEVHLLQNDGKAHMCIKDYGQGIDAEHIPYLTEPFYRVDPARQRETGGYGLGLYLCRIIAEAHDGNLQISSKLGHMTEIKIILPI